MLNSMVDYMHHIAADDFDEMIELLEYKFKKFRSLFHYLSKYSEDIVDISQTGGGHHELICAVTFNSVKIAEKVYSKAMNKEFDKLSSVEINLNGDTLNIVLTEVEAAEPEPNYDESGDSEDEC